MAHETWPTDATTLGTSVVPTADSTDIVPTRQRGRKRPAQAGSGFLEWGMASEPLAGQPESGDLGLVLPFPGGILVGALDGLGHGDEAAAAARAAAEVLRAQPDAPVIWLVRQCHNALGDTRGAVMSLASFSARYGTLTWMGIGNVAGLPRPHSPAPPPPRKTLPPPWGWRSLH